MLNLSSPSAEIRDEALAAPVAVTNRVPVVINGKVMIPLSTAAIGELVAFVIFSQVELAPKNPAEAFTANAPVYWDAANNHFTVTAASGTLCGHVAQPADAAATECDITFNSYAAA